MYAREDYSSDVGRLVIGRWMISRQRLSDQLSKENPSGIIVESIKYQCQIDRDDEQMVMDEVDGEKGIYIILFSYICNEKT